MRPRYREDGVCWFTRRGLVFASVGPRAQRMGEVRDTGAGGLTAQLGLHLALQEREGEVLAGEVASRVEVREDRAQKLTRRCITATLPSR